MATPDAVAYAAAHRGEPFAKDTCLMQVRKAFGIGAKYATAYEAWIGAGGRDGANTHYSIAAPANVPVFYKGSGAAGHIAISAGNGMILSTDIKGNGRWALVKESYLMDKWGMKRLGWSETLNGVRVHPHIHS